MSTSTITQAMILAAGKGQTGRHAFEGILCGLPRRSFPWSTRV